MSKISLTGVTQGLRVVRVCARDRSVWQRFRRNLSISLLGSGLSLAIKLGQTALLAITSLMLVFAIFRPLLVGLDLMRWYNLGLLLSAAVVFVFVASGRLDAAGMAYAQLAGTLILRVLCNVPVWVRLNALAGNSRGQDEPRARGAWPEK